MIRPRTGFREGRARAKKSSKTVCPPPPPLDKGLMPNARENEETAVRSSGHAPPKKY
jgi:hypothetical protein